MIATYHHGESGYLLLDVEVLGAQNESGEFYLEEDINEDDFRVVISEGDVESFIVDSSSSGESDVDSDVQEGNMEAVDVDVITVWSDISEDYEDEFEIIL